MVTNVPVLNISQGDGKNMKTAKYRSTAQIALIIMLIITNIVMIRCVNNIQGVGRVINSAGVVRGGTELIVKQVLFGNYDKSFQDNIDIMMNELQNGGNVYGITKINDSDFQAKLVELENVWTDLKDAIATYREGGDDATEVYNISERHFLIADEAVMLAEIYSQSNSDILHIAVIACSVICILLSGTVVWQIVERNAQNKADSIDNKETEE